MFRLRKKKKKKRAENVFCPPLITVLQKGWSLSRFSAVGLQRCFKSTGGLASSSILDNSLKHYIGTLSSYLHPVLTYFSSSKFIRCYHAQTDGWDSTTFRSKCDGKGPAVSIIKVDNYTIGGYSDVSWKSMHF